MLKTIYGSGWVPFCLVLLFYQASVSKTSAQPQSHSTTTAKHLRTNLNTLGAQDITFSETTTVDQYISTELDSEPNGEESHSKTNAENVTENSAHPADVDLGINSHDSLAEMISESATKTPNKFDNITSKVTSADQANSLAYNQEAHKTTIGDGPVVFAIQSDTGIKTANLPAKTFDAEKTKPAKNTDRQGNRSNHEGHTEPISTLSTPDMHFKDVADKFKEYILSAEKLKYLTDYIKKIYNVEIDFANLLTQYELVCPARGECNFLNMGVLYIPDQFICSNKCECDFRCVSNGNCCPGNIYAYTDQDCVNVQVYPPDEQISHHMIATCPPQYSEHEIIKGCESQPINQSNIQPVTSLDTSLTYKNRFCAQCHGDENIIEWKISVQCPFLYSFNDNFDSFSNLKEEIRKQNCKILFDLDDFSLKPSGCTKLRSAANLIDKCNVTGLWFTDDSDINWACEHYNGYSFLNFKNVFCYLCNPSIISISSPLTIDKCNISQKWTDFDPLLESACVTQPAISRLYPYKNVYCLICNGVISLRQLFADSLSTDEMKVSIDEQLDDKRALLSSLKVSLNFYGENKLSHLTDFIESMYDGNSAPLNKPKEIDKTSEKIDTQYDDYVSVCGNHNTCDLSVHSESLQGLSNPVCKGLNSCSCEENCVESGKCCVDFILKKRPYSCYSKSTVMQFKPGIQIEKDLALQDDDIPCYTMIDKCSKQFNHTLILTKDHLKVLSAVPVRHEGQIAYRNISYLFCNVGEVQNIRIDISVKCSSFFEKSLIIQQTVLPSLINATKQFCAGYFIGESRREKVYNVHWEYVMKQHRTESMSNLDALNIPPSVLKIIDDDYRMSKTTEFLYCNQTGKWITRDDDVLSVCENSEDLGPSFPQYRINGFLYKNYACYICNPEIDESKFMKQDVISTCNVTGLIDSKEILFDEIEALCHTTKPQTRWLPFKNYYCSRCNIPAAELLIVGSSSRHFDADSGTGGTQVQTPYRNLFSLAYADFATLISTPECVNGSYDYSLKICRPLFCRPGKVLRNNTCESLLENGEALSYTLDLTLRMRRHNGNNKRHKENSECGEEEMKITETINLQHVLETFKASVAGKIDLNEPSTKHIFSGCVAFTNVHCLDPSAGGGNIVYLYLLKDISIQCDIDVSTTKNRNVLESVLVDTLTDMYKVETMSGKNVCLRAEPKDSHISQFAFSNEQRCMYSENNFFLFSYNAHVDRFFTCVQIKLDETEYTIDNTTYNLILEKSNIVIDRTYYKLDGTSARVCLKDYRRFTSSANSTGSNSVDKFLKAYNIFSEVCSILSMVCLFITFVTYCLFSSLRTLPGKNNMVLCLCMFCAQGTLQFGMSLKDTTEYPACTIMGIAIHYLWLATFFSMNVCSFHMFRVFCSKAMSVPSLSRKRFSKYLLYVFSMPFVIVSTTFTIFFVSSSGTFTGYGGIRCFLTNIYGIVCAFIIPSSLIFLTNIIFFILAFHKIRTSPRIQSSGDKREFFVYIKLCTVVGVTWPLQIVDAVLPLTIFSFFVVGLNASQGVFVCFSYVCNRRVFYLYKKSCSKDFNQLQSGTSGKTNSTEMSERGKENGV